MQPSKQNLQQMLTPNSLQYPMPNQQAQQNFDDEKQPYSPGRQALLIKQFSDKEMEEKLKADKNAN